MEYVMCVGGNTPIGQHISSGSCQQVMKSRFLLKKFTFYHGRLDCSPITRPNIQAQSCTVSIVSHSVVDTDLVGSETFCTGVLKQ
jgi:hypothetical protein